MLQIPKFSLAQAGKRGPRVDKYSLVDIDEKWQKHVHCLKKLEWKNLKCFFVNGHLQKTRTLTVKFKIFENCLQYAHKASLHITFRVYTLHIHNSSDGTRYRKLYLNFFAFYANVYTDHHLRKQTVVRFLVRHALSYKIKPNAWAN